MLSNQRFGRADDYVLSLKDRYQALSLDGVQAAAEEVMHPDRLIWLVVGDRATIEMELRELDLGPVSIMDTDGNIIE